MLDDLLRSPVVKRALAVGEERMGKLVTQLLSSERLMQGVQTVVASALNAKSTIDRGVKTAMQAVNLPTTDDVDELRRKLSELETMIDGLAEKVARGEARVGGHRPNGSGTAGRP